MTQLLSMVAGICAVVASLFFLRFWRDTRDRFFVLFATAFFVLGVHWTMLAVVRSQGVLVEPEHAAYHYGLRLLGFVLILAAIIDKNRR